MTMDDEAAAGLALPDRETLLDYARRALAAVERAAGVVDDEQWLEPDATSRAYHAGLGQEPPDSATVGSAILEHLAHENRHLGEIECLRGAQGLRGTATV
jgi:hypothetical protein